MNSTSKEKVLMQAKVTGEGRPLVLVPGGLTGWVSWDSFVDHFTTAHKVIQVQLLNVQYGLEGKLLPEEYSVKFESSALEATLDSIGFKGKTDFIGWSYGGLVLLDYVLNHPERVNTLTLIEPPALWLLKNDGEVDQGTQDMLDFLSSVPKDKNNVTEDELDKFLAFAGFVKPGQSARELPQWNSWTKFRQSLRNNQAVHDHMDKSERITSIPFPVLLVKGTGSSPFLHKIIDSLGKKITNQKTVEFPGGHAPHLVSKDYFLMAVDSLISVNQ